MDETKLKQFKELLALTTGSLTKEEFLSFSQKVLEYVKTIKSTTESDLQTISQAVKTAISRIESTASDNYAKTEEKLTKEQESALNDIQFKVEALIAEAQQKLDEVKSGEDGVDADEERVITEVLARLPEPKEETPETVRDLLETLEGEDRLKIDAIDKLREELDRLEKEIKSKNTTVMGGARGVGVLDEGQTVALSAQWLNFTGAGVSVSNVGNQTVIQIAGGSGGTPVQDSDVISGTTITLAHAPTTNTLLLYINGQFQHPVTDYTLSGVTISNLPAEADGLTYTVIYEY
jgi:hypothetical protein